MGEAQWWLYDLVVLAIAGLCLWNGISKGLTHSICGLMLSLVACLVAYLVSPPLAEMTYDAWVKEPCQQVIAERLPQYDLLGEVRGELSRYGISIPVSDAELGDLLRKIDDDETLQVLELFGIDPDTIRQKVGSEIAAYIENADGLLPEWAQHMVTAAEPEVITHAAVETAADLLAGDRGSAAQVLEDAFLRPVVVSFLQAILFALIAILVTALLRLVLLVLPRGGALSQVNQLLGGAFGIVKAGVYLLLIVVMTQCIAAMQDGAYPFFSEETIERTLLFRSLYHLMQF